MRGTGGGPGPPAKEHRRLGCVLPEPWRTMPFKPHPRFSAAHLRRGPVCPPVHDQAGPHQHRSHAAAIRAAGARSPPGGAASRSSTSTRATPAPPPPPGAASVSCRQSPPPSPPEMTSLPAASPGTPASTAVFSTGTLTCSSRFTPVPLQNLDSCPGLGLSLRHAARSYSLIRPPRTCLHSMVEPVCGHVTGVGGCGGCWSRDWCGRCLL